MKKDKKKKPVKEDWVLTNLPPEILLFIFSYLTPKELALASLVCHDWHAFAGDNALWSRFFKPPLRSLNGDSYKQRYIDEFNYPFDAAKVNKVAAVDLNVIQNSVCYPSCFSGKPDVIISGANSIITFIAYFSPYQESMSSKNKFPQVVSCVAEYFDEGQFYILQLYFQPSTEGHYLSANYLTLEEANAYNQLIGSADRLTWECVFAGENIEKNLNRITENKHRIYLENRREVDWFCKFLCSSSGEANHLQNLNIKHHCDLFKRKMVDNVLRESPQRQQRHCIIS